MAARSVFDRLDYFGIAAAPEAAGATPAADAGTAVGESAGAEAGPGICAEPVAGTLAAGAVSTGRSSTLPLDGRPRSFEKNASASVVPKNTAAQAAVERDRKLALPVAPNRLPEAPLPNDAPMSAPLPCCSSTSPIMASAVTICRPRTRFITMFMQCDFLLVVVQPAARQMAMKSAALSDAPPIRPPSRSGSAKSCAALSALTLPP